MLFYPSYKVLTPQKYNFRGKIAHIGLFDGYFMDIFRKVKLVTHNHSYTPYIYISIRTGKG